MIIYQNEMVRIETEACEIPWLKICTQETYKENSELPHNLKMEIFELLDLIEKEMIRYFRPEKINIASFGNYIPTVHWHIMARFKEDSYFPEPIWGKKQRESNLQLPDFQPFYDMIAEELNTKIRTYEYSF